MWSLRKDVSESTCTWTARSQRLSVNTTMAKLWTRRSTRWQNFRGGAGRRVISLAAIRVGVLSLYNMITAKLCLRKRWQRVRDRSLELSLSARSGNGTGSPDDSSQSQGLTGEATSHPSRSRTRWRCKIYKVPAPIFWIEKQQQDTYTGGSNLQSVGGSRYAGVPGISF